MNKITPYRKTCFSFCTIVLTLLLFSPLQARGETYYLNNNTYRTSQLTGSGNVYMITGEVTLIVDKETSISHIEGTDKNATLRISTAAGFDLNVNYSGDRAIDVANIGISGDGTVSAIGEKRGFRATNLTLTNADVYSESRSGKTSIGMSAYNLEINDSYVKASGHVCGLSSNTVTINGSKSIVEFIGRGKNEYDAWLREGHGNGIGVQTGQLTVNDGKVKISSYMNSAIHAELLEINGGIVNVSNSFNQNHPYFEWELNGKLTAIKLTQYGAVTIYDELNMTGGYMKIDTNHYGLMFASNAGANVSGGYLEVSAGKGYEAIFNHNISTGTRMNGILDFSGNASLRLSGSHEAIDWCGNIFIENRHTIAESRAEGYNAIKCDGSLTFTLGEGLHKFITKGGKEPIYATGSIGFYNPFEINQQSFGLISQDFESGPYAMDHYLVKSATDNTNIKGTATIGKPDISKWKTPWLQSNTFIGHCFDQTFFAPTEPITFYLPDEVKNYVADSRAEMTIEWWRRNNNAADLMNSELVATGLTYTPTVNDVGKYFMAMVKFNTHRNFLLTTPVLIAKRENNKAPDWPNTSYRLGKIMLSNPRADQEYIVRSEYVAPGSLKEDDWANAVRPSGTSAITLTAAVSGSEAYVYTRFRETDTHNAGSVVRYGATYFGSTATYTGYMMTPSVVNGELTLLNDNNIAVPFNSVVKIDFTPIPATATDFPGIPGAMISCINLAGDIAYSDAACTQPVVADENHFYKTIYVKCNTTTTSSSNIGMFIVSPFNKIKSRSLLIYVANANGTYNLTLAKSTNGTGSGETEVLYVTAGNSSKELIHYLPSVASIDNLTLSEPVFYSLNGVDNTGTLPSITIDHENKVVNIDATNSEPGLWARYRYLDNGRQVGGIELFVIGSKPKGISISPAEIYVDPLEGSCQLNAVLMPANATGTVTWTSSDTDIATVDANGKVTLADDMDILGEKVIITATCGDYSAQATLNIGGEKFPLWINGERVNSFNREDILGDGKVFFDGKMLTISNGAAFNSSGNYTIKSELEDLNINLDGASTITTSEFQTAISSPWDINFMGNGQLNINGNRAQALMVQNITMSDNVILDVNVPNYLPINAVSLSVNSENATLHSVGSQSAGAAHFSDSFRGVVVDPVGALWNPDNGLFFLNGSLVYDLTVTGEAGSSFVLGDVNGDGNVNAGDVSAIYGVILGTETDPAVIERANINGDTVVNAGDISSLYEIILAK